MAAGVTAPSVRAASQEASSYVGRSMVRPEDIPLLRGEAEFVGDVRRPGQLVARIVRSDVAHGAILGIDATEALALDGVHAVITAADMPEFKIPLRLPVGHLSRLEKALQPPLAAQRVRYVGEPVAVVVADTQAIAEDAAALVFADIDPLPALTSCEQALEADGPILHEAAGGNVIDELYWRRGDVDSIFATADVVVKQSFGTQRQTGAPLETRGLVAEYDVSLGRLTLWGAAKVKHFNRGVIAGFLGLPEEAVNLVECEVGGGFGVRGELYPEDLIIPWLARHLGRPVKWIEDRLENLVATNHSREQEHVLEIAASRDGKLLAFRDRARSDIGAYVRTHGAIVQWATTSQMPGPYDWAGFEVEHQLVCTNKTPTGTYRGPGGVEASFVRERLIDQVADELGLSPLELRRKNLIRPSQLPYRIEYDEGEGAYQHDTGDYPHLWDTMVEQADIEALSRSIDTRRANGEVVGWGTAVFAEVAVFGPWEQARVTPGIDGRFTVAIGVSSVGQGLRTALGQLTADLLCVPFEHVVIDYHSTDSTPFGFGAFASRVTTVGGNAIAAAVEDLKQRGREAAADRLGVHPSEVTVEPGGVLRAPSGESLTFKELGVEGQGRFDKHELSVGFGGALAVVSVDAKTGRPTVERILVAAEIGRPVNPMLVQGQLVGAAIQGLGGALLESLRYDDGGQPLSTTFADYLLPTSTDVPPVEVCVVVTPVSTNPLGLGPAGENGIYGVAPAVANAVADALGRKRGTCTTLPLTAESVWLAMR
jgi:carbon-monoxide dehydrogenase large subunit